MPTPSEKNKTDDVVEFDLKDPLIATLLTWLLPGAGHYYQGRMAKAAVFFVCILGTYFFGLSLAGGHVVYADWSGENTRWHLLGQMGVGGPSMLAVIQSQIVKSGGQPVLNGLMAPPIVDPGAKGFKFDGRGTLAQWHYRYHRRFELGTVYTMVAGFLNVLAMYDAFAGPVGATEEEDEKPPEEDEPPPDSDSAEKEGST